MATTTNPTTPRVCPKDCSRCTMPQQMYCAAQLSFNAFEAYNSILQRMDVIEDTIRGLQPNKDALIMPMSEAQEGSGATKIDSQDN